MKFGIIVALLVVSLINVAEAQVSIGIANGVIVEKFECQCTFDSESWFFSGYYSTQGSCCDNVGKKLDGKTIVECRGKTGKDQYGYCSDGGGVEALLRD